MWYLFVIKGLNSEMLKVCSCCDGGILEKDLFPLPWNEFGRTWVALTKKCKLIISVGEAFPSDFVQVYWVILATWLNKTKNTIKCAARTGVKRPAQSFT